MSPPDIKADALRTFSILKAGGIALVPTSVGYALAGLSSDSLQKIFTTKKRGAHKRHPMMGTYSLHQELHIMSPLSTSIVQTLTQDFNLPLAIIARYRKEHPLMESFDQETLEASTADGTMQVKLY